MTEMTQEEKDLLLKDLCSRLPYGVKVQNVLNGSIYDLKKYLHCLPDALITNFKPYLRPLSSMTEEERDLVEDISNGWFYIDEDGEIYPIGRLTDSCQFEDSILPTFEYLYKEHFDFRGLIKKGLAIEINEDNNPYED